MVLHKSDRTQVSFRRYGQIGRSCNYLGPVLKVRSERHNGFPKHCGPTCSGPCPDLQTGIEGAWQARVDFRVWGSPRRSVRRDTDGGTVGARPMEVGRDALGRDALIKTPAENQNVMVAKCGLWVRPSGTFVRLQTPKTLYECRPSGFRKCARNEERPEWGAIQTLVIRRSTGGFGPGASINDGWLAARPTPPETPPAHAPASPPIPAAHRESPRRCPGRVGSGAGRG